MADPFIGEIRLLPFTYAPYGWYYCDGTAVSIKQNQALFAVLGKTYGYDQQNGTFNLPDLRGLVPVGFGQGPGLSPYTLGQKGGEAQIQLDETTIPSHDHTAFAASAPATDQTPGTTDYLAIPNVSTSESWKAYAPTGTTAQLAPQFVGPVGGSQAHENRQPFLALGFCIAWDGIWPANS